MSSATKDADGESGPSGFRTVQSHRDVCGNCFRRTHNTYERNYAVDTVRAEPFEPAEIWLREVDLPDIKIPVKENRVPVPRDLAAHGTVNYCKCGQPPGDQFRPLPKDVFFDYAEHLYQRYVEFGIPVDRNTFFTKLDELKSDPDRQFADDRLYEKATEYAVKR